MLKRRQFVATSASALAAANLVRAGAASVLRFVPQADVAVLDPVGRTPYWIRDHDIMVFGG